MGQTIVRLKGRVRIRRRGLLVGSLAGALLAALPGAAAADDAAEAQQTVDKAKVTVENFKADPDMTWFRDNVPNAKAVMVVPVLVKAGLIVAVFMHMMWERLALLYAIIVPPVLVMVFIAIMALESDYTFDTRYIFFVGGS